MKRTSILSALSGASILAIAACSSSSAGPTPSESAASTAEAIVSSNPSWVGWGTLDGGVVSDPAVFAYDANDVGALATNGSLWFNWFSVLGWTGWMDLGNAGNPLVTQPVAVRVGNSVEVFVQDLASGFLLHLEGTLNGRNKPTWGAWETIALLQTQGAGVAPTGPLASFGGAPAVWVSQPNNQINVAATFGDYSVKVMSGTGAVGHWSLWTDLGGSSRYQPAAVSWGANRHDLFVTSTNAGVYHRWSTDNAVTWNSAWEALGGNSASQPTVVSWGPNRLDVFASGRPSGQITGVQHLAWNGASWGWESLRFLVWQDQEHGMAAPVAITSGVGAINVFVQSIDQGLTTLAMTGSTWGNEQELATCFRTGGRPAALSPDGTNVEVLVTGNAANGGAGAVYANGTSTLFNAGGTTAPPTCDSCGYPGAVCCWPSNQCGDGASCSAAVRCQCDPGFVQTTKDGRPACAPSGDLGELCNANGTCNSSTLACTGAGGTCQCASGFAQLNGQGPCVPAGEVGEPCNGNHTCNGDAYCQDDGTCIVAGKWKQHCLQDNTCVPGLACFDGVCLATGENGDHCNADGSCNAGALLCDGGFCQPCGGTSTRCCKGDARSNTGSRNGGKCDDMNICSGNQCIECGKQEGEPCCPVPANSRECSGLTVCKGLSCVAQNGDGSSSGCTMSKYIVCEMCNAEPVPLDPVYACSLQDAEATVRAGLPQNVPCTVTPGACPVRHLPPGGIDPPPVGKGGSLPE